MENTLLISEKVESTVNSMLYILNSLEGEVDFHRLFKILYFAERDHLVRYGKSITQDVYIAMDKGPVPSLAYDILKALRGEGLMAYYQQEFEHYFQVVKKYHVIAKIKHDPDALSESVLECLHKAVVKYGHKSFKELTGLSHDDAWKNADKNSEINIFDIARAGGANPEMIAYIVVSSENSHAVFR
jgi:uncharacterized phage-associated protein